MQSMPLRLFNKNGFADGKMPGREMVIYFYRGFQYRFTCLMHRNADLGQMTPLLDKHGNAPVAFAAVRLAVMLDSIVTKGGTRNPF
jgi:hypothetical protein